MLAVTTAKRTSRWPDTPTFAEQGKAEATMPLVIGALAPLHTPQEVVDRLAAAFDQARRDPGFIAWAERTNQPIGDEGWNSKTFYEALKKTQASLQQIIPDLRAELKKVQEGA
jgi:tripartite-type tricarboxylate transporter receptor subunit TctC